LERGAALTSRVQSFETELLTQAENLAGLAALNRKLVAKGEAIDSRRRVVLDMDSTEIPVYGRQELRDTAFTTHDRVSDAGASQCAFRSAAAQLGFPRVVRKSKTSKRCWPAGESYDRLKATRDSNHAGYEYEKTGKVDTRGKAVVETQPARTPNEAPLTVRVRDLN
jgi:LAS superfamily LD-carboxypeptidase LdcB